MKVKQDNVLEWVVTLITATVGGVWGGIDPWLKVLFILMFLDIMAAFWRHMSSGTLDIKVATAGANKKVMVAILVTTSIVVQYYVAELVGYMVPLTTAITGFYAGRELLSILRHAAASGISIPKPLIDVGERIEQVTSGDNTARKEAPDAGKP